MTSVTTSLLRLVPLAVVLAAVASGCGGSSDRPQASCVPAAETCNGLDDDCDGAADDGDPGGGAGCSTGLLGVCAAGVQHCQGGELACVQVTASSAETCNLVDDDCDGTVDEVFNLATDPQNCGLCGRVCTFAHAVAQCVSSTCVLGACDVGFVDLDAAVNGCEYACPVMPPSAEACNGLDDDCDGIPDSGNPGGGLACDTGLLGVCASGVTACTGGALTCVQNTQAGSEVCPNGLDDDCDGVVDECPYAHTIGIGVGSPNDFTFATEEFATTTPGYTAYVTWDADHLYVGYHGAEVGTTPWRWLVVYVDVRAGTAGRSTGSTFNTQTVSFPEGFTADYEIATTLDGNSERVQVTREVQAGSWVAFAPSPAVNTALYASFNYIEMGIPLAALGDPATVGITLLVLRDSLWSEFAYGGLYQDAFISGAYDGTNVPVANYLLADLASTRAPNDPANKRP